ncbi:uncharacterized protein BO80DRAFT_448005 [Aspergillus ibericus CBS 121593]|uniref:Uncharacterized protein n=1 Tax=Aspergillus ibericus CBS 121593 TaxID=1448316 RepID=A0A395GQQ9_9EURO|nr:hypothetical protein BO80DRAFT_448005 [Aspergillus ibericus CBS 121593]RAK97809.1 hypothetical protein BO80DRAFT_448005 [Aspergillus ibericus CBS 121593]
MSGTRFDATMPGLQAPLPTQGANLRGIRTFRAYAQGGRDKYRPLAGDVGEERGYADGMLTPSSPAPTWFTRHRVQLREVSSIMVLRLQGYPALAGELWPAVSSPGLVAICEARKRDGDRYIKIQGCLDHGYPENAIDKTRQIGNNAIAESSRVKGFSIHAKLRG